MLEVVKRLRKEPEHKRRRVLVFSTLGAMVIILFVWVGSIGYEFGNGSNSAKNTAQVANPFSTLGSIFSDMLKNAKESANVLTPPLPSGPTETTPQNSSPAFDGTAPAPSDLAPDDSSAAPSTTSDALPLSPYSPSWSDN